MSSAQALLTPISIQATLFPPTSRYYGLPTAMLQSANGSTLIYLTRRFIPQADQFVVVQMHVVAEDERLDNIASTYLGDPTAFWRLCDANGTMRPEELTETLGRALRITLPQGIPGLQSA